jgi:hypothetical protein
MVVISGEPVESPEVNAVQRLISLLSAGISIGGFKSQRSGNIYSQSRYLYL